MRLYFYLILVMLVAVPSMVQAGWMQEPPAEIEVTKEQVVGEPGQDDAIRGESNPEDLVSLKLTELEALKGENLQLKYDSIDKQMRLVQIQYSQLQARQAEIIGELQEVQREILKSHGLEGTIDWKEKKINPTAKEVNSEENSVSEEKE